MATRRKPKRWFKRLLQVAAALLLFPVVLIALMRWIDPLTSAFMAQRQAELWMSGTWQWVKYDWVDWDYIAPAVPLAAVAAEDQRFPQHFGFDFEAIADALEGNASGGAVRGASTISQQVAKNLFLWSGRSWVRKGLEAYLTLAIEVLWPKRRILEVYVNIAQFGPNVFGIGAASQEYFGKIPVRISAHEAALLAAVLPNPVRFRVDQPSGYVQGRALRIQGQMRQLGSDYLRNL